MLIRKKYIRLFFLFVVFLLAVRSCMIKQFNPNWSELSFDKKVWDSSAAITLDNPRALMAGDLKKIILKEEMSRERIIYFLGEPDLLNAQERDNPSLLRYYLGEPCVGTSICQLEIKLSPDSLVDNVVFH